MLDPDDAYDILLDQVALAQWAEAHGLEPRAARAALMKIAENATDDSALLRQARATHERRGRRVAQRTDVEQLVNFVERAARLPLRVREVFKNCIVDGLSHAECADHLGIAPATVRVHLRRLRQAMRRTRAGGHQQNYPGFPNYPGCPETPGNFDDPG